MMGEEAMKKMERALWKEGIELNLSSTGKYLIWPFYPLLSLAEGNS